MNLADRTEIASLGMDGVHDVDTSKSDYARAAAKALGWIRIADELPALEDVVVCTDGTARWLDKRTEHFLDMKWTGHTPTHWHPLADLVEVRT